MKKRLLLFALLGYTIFLLWFLRAPVPVKPLYRLETTAGSATPWGAEYMSNEVGQLQGTINWVGQKPTITPLNSQNAAHGPRDGYRDFPNPHTPQINGSGLGATLVYLEKVDPQRSEPISFAPVNIQVSNQHTIEMKQGGAPSRFAFVAPGSSIELSTQLPLQAITCRGSFFHTQQLQSNQSVKLTLERPGLIEVSSGSGLYWSRSYLVVLDHPYYTVTDAEGNFVLKNIPPGKYQLVAYHPNWNITSFERDPEWIGYVRANYAAGIQKKQTIEIISNQKSQAKYQFSAADFKP